MRWIFGWCLLLVGLQAESANQPPVDLIPMPDRGVQPQVQVGPSGDIHLVYHKGVPGEGDLFYVRMKPDLGEWSTIQINRLPHSAVATGTVGGTSWRWLATGRFMSSGLGTSTGRNPRVSLPSRPLMIATLPAGQEAFTLKKSFELDTAFWMVAALWPSIAMEPCLWPGMVEGTQAGRGAGSRDLHECFH